MSALQASDIERLVCGQEVTAVSGDEQAVTLVFSDSTQLRLTEPVLMLKGSRMPPALYEQLLVGQRPDYALVLVSDHRQSLGFSEITACLDFSVAAVV